MAGKAWARANLFKAGGGVAEASPPAHLSAWLARLQLGPSQVLGGLELVPLVHPDALAEPDLLAPQAIAAGLLDVREKDGGTVQELMATNRAARPVLLFEGEILLGAKQNRMVAHTVVIAPGATIVIPVGCVERGRWQWTAPGFSASLCVAEPALRRSAKASVAAARASSGRVALDQRALWNEVDVALDCEGVRSETSDYHEVSRRRAAEDDAALARVPPLERQVGVMALRDGALVALDVVGSTGTWRAVRERIMRSLLPASRQRARARGLRGARAWLDHLRTARMRPQPAVGLGRDLAIEVSGLVGSGVWLETRPAHVSVFGDGQA